ncbi:MAG: D-alanine--D-alanine ligase [Candidatus Paceibacterota bacterium]
MKILILFNRAVVLKKGVPGDLVCEQEIDIIVPLVEQVLRSRGHEVMALEAAIDLWSRLLAIKGEIDIVLNLAEGFGGSNTNEATVPAILEALGIPFTGASLRNMIYTMDKEKTNLTVSGYGIPTPRREVFRPEVPLPIETRLPFPVIVKPVWEEASVGITDDSVVSNQADLARKVRQVFSFYRQPALVERFVIGREISVGIVGNGQETHIFPPLEFVFDPAVPELQRIRSYEYKWGGTKENMVKAQLPAATIALLRRYTRVAYRVMDCRDYARIDYRLTSGGRIFLLEVNYNPGIGPNTHGLNNTLTMMASFEDVSFGDLIERIVVTAKNRYIQ